MANPLKILTVLTASQAAQFKEAVELSGAVTARSGVTVSAGNVDVSAGTLSVAGAITASSGVNVNSQKIEMLASGTVSSDAVNYGQLTSVSGALKTYVDAQNTAQNLTSSFFSGAVSSSFAAERAARAAEDLTFLKLDGSRAMSGALNMGGQDITSAKSGSFSGDVTVGGNLQVNGALTYINTTNLDVTDKLVTLAKGAVNGAAANGGGIELEGAGASLTYAETGDKWVSNKSFQVAADLFISGASDFSYINVARSAGQYDVDAAIQALDVAVSGAVNAGGNFKSDYNAHRHVATGNLSSGQAVLNLTTLGGAEFAAAEISKIALDVMIDADSTGYTNDLVAIKMYVDGADVKVQIDAPATPEAAYRLIAVNEEDIA